MDGSLEKSFANDRSPRYVAAFVKPLNRRLAALSTCVAVALVVALSVRAGSGVRVSRLGGGPATAGKGWLVRLAVRPKSYGGAVRVVAAGTGRVAVRARGGRGSYRATLVFPAPGLWRLSARAGGGRSRLGSVRVRPAPLVLDQPTGIAAGPGRTLLAVEFGQQRLVRVDSATGRVTKVASFIKPWGVARAASGRYYVSDSNWVKRVDAGRAPRIVATVDPGLEVGPVTVAPNGDVYYTTTSALYRLPQGAGPPQQLAAGTPLAGPHGLAGAADGSLLVSDSGDDLIRRVDSGGSVTTFATIGSPRGIAFARDGSVYVGAGDERRVVHFSATGERLGTVGPRFKDVYALAVAGDGTVYAVDIGADLIRRIAPAP
jgi:sugar lactone lactonase YvrE